MLRIIAWGRAPEHHRAAACVLYVQSNAYRQVAAERNSMKFGAYIQLLSRLCVDFGLGHWWVRAVSDGVEEASHEHYVTIMLEQTTIGTPPQRIDVTVFGNGDWSIGKHHDYA